jgi:hypothetical protein
MTLDQWVAVFSASVSFLGLMFVALQIREATKQRRLESIHNLFNTNRELLALGFEHPLLFNVLNDVKCADPEMEKRYLQIWLNHASMVHVFLKNGGFDAEFRQSIKNDIRYLMMLQNMQRHWLRCSQYYPASFQKLVNSIIYELEGQ